MFNCLKPEMKNFVINFVGLFHLAIIIISEIPKIEKKIRKFRPIQHVEFSFCLPFDFKNQKISQL